MCETAAGRHKKAMWDISLERLGAAEGLACVAAAADSPRKAPPVRVSCSPARDGVDGARRSPTGTDGESRGLEIESFPRCPLRMLRPPSPSCKLPSLTPPQLAANETFDPAARSSSFNRTLEEKDKEEEEQRKREKERRSGSW